MEFVTADVDEKVDLGIVAVVIVSRNFNSVEQISINRAKKLWKITEGLFGRLPTAFD